MPYALGDTFRIPGFPDETLLVIGALVRVDDALDVAAVAVHNVPRLGPDGGPGQCGSLPITLAALDASGLLPMSERAPLPKSFLEGVGNWLGNEESRGATFTVPVGELLNLLSAKLRQD
jgi:hypothetical protein